ncbi:uncharacterized protein LOC109535313 isoform X4 [Dendroctonus ponderosae]|uniref:uncharacterized protein LOC109535313 isoform X4 n=1 Tax=Dendroctonus ponderosae TaxID=77166 RepID=UPI002035C77F|nr:uncharacterized protein LOC109535313 isoform X4 [Dendroctonus ponderosae]
MEKMPLAWCLFWLLFGFFRSSSIHGEAFAQAALGQNPFPMPINQPFPGVMPFPPYPYGPLGGSPWGGQPHFPGYPQQYPGYPQPVGAGFPGWSAQDRFLDMNKPQANGAMVQNGAGDNTANIPVEILDVSPEYQRQLLGWPAEESSTKPRAFKPRYKVDVDSHTTNYTQILANLTKPIITEKKYVTSIRKSFVYDPSKPDNNKPINIHLVNGQQVTTLPPTTTTESENVEGITSWYDSANGTNVTSIIPKGRRFIDVPISCAEGRQIAHNGRCLSIFLLKSPLVEETENKNSSEAAP